MRASSIGRLFPCRRKKTLDQRDWPSRRNRVSLFRVENMLLAFERYMDGMRESNRRRDGYIVSLCHTFSQPACGTSLFIWMTSLQWTRLEYNSFHKDHVLPNLRIKTTNPPANMLTFPAPVSDFYDQGPLDKSFRITLPKGHSVKFSR